jgi:hypothetical protein
LNSIYLDYFVARFPEHSFQCPLGVGVYALLSLLRVFMPFRGSLPEGIKKITA